MEHELTDHPNTTDYLNRHERNLAYWAEQEAEAVSEYQQARANVGQLAERVMINWLEEQG